MGDKQIFDFDRARVAASNLAAYAREIESAERKLSLSLKQVDWWKGDSKDGYINRIEPLLKNMKSAAGNAKILAEDLKQIAQNKEAEEKELKSALTNSVVINT